jgi:hypothetical protein
MTDIVFDDVARRMSASQIDKIKTDFFSELQRHILP